MIDSTIPYKYRIYSFAIKQSKHAELEILYLTTNGCRMPNFCHKSFYDSPAESEKSFTLMMTQHWCEKPLFTLFYYCVVLYFLHKITNRITSHIFYHFVSSFLHFAARGKEYFLTRINGGRNHKNNKYCIEKIQCSHQIISLSD